MILTPLKKNRTQNVLTTRYITYNISTAMASTHSKKACENIWKTRIYVLKSNPVVFAINAFLLLPKH